MGMSQLEKCPACGNPCSENAFSCPKCGEPLAEGWAVPIRQQRLEAEKLAKIANEEERQEKQEAIKTRKKRKIRNRLILWAVIFMGVAGFYGKSQFEQYQLSNLKTSNPQEFTRLVSELEAEVATVPVSDFEENIRIYKELMALDPDNERYANKVAHYEERMRMAKEEEERVAKAVEQAAKEEERRKGFHCLSQWNGAHSGVERYIEKNLKDPDSYEHIETRITPVNEQGEHTLIVTYRAKNSFGGMTVGITTATIRNNDCHATILTSE